MKVVPFFVFSSQQIPSKNHSQNKLFIQIGVHGIIHMSSISSLLPSYLSIQKICRVYFVQVALCRVQIALSIRVVSYLFSPIFITCTCTMSYSAHFWCFPLLMRSIESCRNIAAIIFCCCNGCRFPNNNQMKFAGQVCSERN